jgi:hypothetical protein
MKITQENTTQMPADRKITILLGDQGVYENIILKLTSKSKPVVYLVQVIK